MEEGYDHNALVLLLFFDQHFPYIGNCRTRLERSSIEGKLKVPIPILGIKID